MLVSEKLVLLPLHKEGVAPVKQLFQALVGGETRKQPGSAADIVALGVPVVGLVCSPLTWYLALWRQGCAGKGGLYRRLTDDARWQRVLGRQQARHSGDDVKETLPAGESRAGRLPAGWSAAHAAAVWYADRNNATAFREWLRAVLGTRALRRIVEAQPTAGSSFRAGGLMTQEYLAAFVQAPEDESLSTLKLEGLQALDHRCAITSMFIRAESLAADVAAVLDQLGIDRDAQQDEAIRALATEAGTADELDFFDADSLKLVAQHERLITTKFGYELTTGAASEGAKADRPRARRRLGRGKERRGAEAVGLSDPAEVTAQRPQAAVEATLPPNDVAGSVASAQAAPAAATKRARKKAAKSATRSGDTATAGSEGNVDGSSRRRRARRAKPAADDLGPVADEPADV